MTSSSTTGEVVVARDRHPTGPTDPTDPTAEAPVVGSTAPSVAEPGRSSADATSFRWAILGSGEVARKFALGIGQSPTAGRAHVVASRDRANAARLAELAGVAEVAEAYEDAIGSPGVDGGVAM